MLTSALEEEATRSQEDITQEYGHFMFPFLKNKEFPVKKYRYDCKALWKILCFNLL